MQPNRMLETAGATCWSARWLAGVACLLCLGVSSARAQATRNIVPSSATTSDWAILVAVEAEGDGADTAYRTNDVELLRATLRTCGWREHRILAMTQKAAVPGLHPLQTNVTEQVPRLLSKVGANDRLLVYLAAPAYRDSEGHVYLAPADWDARRLAATGLSLAWLREQLSACPAKVKLLVIDAEKDDESGDDGLASVGGQEAGVALDGVDGLAGWASCRDGQRNLTWEPMGQSLFGFWFGQALAGHADRDGNRLVSMAELHDFVFEKVARTAKDTYQQEQTPMRLFDARAMHSVPVSRTSSVTLRSALDTMAAELTQVAVEHGVTRLGVAEFRSPELGYSTIGLLSGEYGVLGRWCSEQMERCLAQHAEAASSRFEVTPHHALHATLARGNFSPASFRAGNTRGITVKGKPVQAIALGSFCARTGQVLTLRCDLHDTQGQRLLGRVQATALLSESEWAMLGRSGAVKPHDASPPQAPSPEHPVPPGEAADQVIARLEESAEEAPPPRYKGFPFRVRVLVDGEQRPGVTIQNNEYVPLSRGEVYQVVVENQSERQAYLRLLIDGLNTLPEPVRTAGDSAETSGRRVVYLPAQRVHLDQAKAWRLSPRPNGAEAKAHLIRGFYQRIGKKPDGSAMWEWETFKVVDAPESRASRQQYTEQIGLITAAFFDIPDDGTTRGRGRGIGGIGTAGGEKQQGKLDEYQEAPIGRLLGVINIHYVEPETLDRLTRDQAASDSAGEDDAGHSGDEAAPGGAEPFEQTPNEPRETPTEESPPASDVVPENTEEDADNATGNDGPTGPAAALVMKYLAAAATLDPSATKPFLSATCQVDMVTELRANAESHWNYSVTESQVIEETLSDDEDKATVVVRLVFQGGRTLMATKHTFSLVLQDGAWQISAMDPSPRTAGPGVIPLGR